MGVDERSNELFGRYQALRVYAEIARLAKEEFTTGQIATLAATSGPDASKELGRLVRLELIAPASRRGDYTRDPDSPFWELVDELARRWGY